MASSAIGPASTQVADHFQLTPQQVRFFETFGFLHLRALFRDDVNEMTTAFEHVFASASDPYVVPENPYHRVRDPRFGDTPRVTIRELESLHPYFEQLSAEPRILAIASALLGEGHEYQVADGNLFYCDVYWHLDGYGTTTDEDHIKLYFYLDSLRSGSGALRVLPGSHVEGSPYTTALRQLFFDIDAAPGKVGVALDEIPGYTIDVEPGDLIVGNFRTIHGSFGGGPRRRLVTMDFHRGGTSA
jgi:ectoine hydroxylase-related dioxygenase (phytanoyl-CoA dioxygenase family)